MRLEPSRVEAILRCAREAYGPDVVVRLSGWRVDDTRRGGDIDLHLDVPDTPDWYQRGSDFH